MTLPPGCYEAYSPLGGLSNWHVLSYPEVKAVAAAHKVSAAVVALRWVLQQGVPLVTATGNAAYIKEDLAVVDGPVLSAKEMATLSAITGRPPTPAPTTATAAKTAAAPAASAQWGAAAASHVWDIQMVSDVSTDHLPAVSPAMVAELNARPQRSWTAHLPSEVPTRGEVKQLCGSPRPGWPWATPSF
jgi:hypothetical protein